jgi:hypothetical protein
VPFSLRVSGIGSNALVGVRLPMTTTSSATPSKPLRVATIVWSAPFGTVGVAWLDLDPIRHRGFHVRWISSSAFTALRTNAGPSVTTPIATAVTVIRAAA